MSKEDVQAQANKMLGLFMQQVKQSKRTGQEHVTMHCLNPESGGTLTNVHTGDEEFAHNMPCPLSHPRKLIRFHTHPHGTSDFSGGDIAGNLYERVELDCIGYPTDGKGQIRCVRRRPHIDPDAEKAFIEKAARFQSLCNRWADIVHGLPGAAQEHAIAQIRQQVKDINKEFRQFVEDVPLRDKEAAEFEFPLATEVASDGV